MNTVQGSIPKEWLNRAAQQLPVEVRPDTWSKAGYPRMAAHGPFPSAISRADLTALAGDRSVRDDDAGLGRLFVLLMMWGSGKTNGRGPRYTEEVLGNANVLGVLRTAWDLVDRGEVSEAYYLDRRLRGIGPAFFTKWLWLVGTTATSDTAPLVLDANVWRALRDLGWDSLAAADGKRSWGLRYVAYLNACAAWAGHAEVEPVDIEYSLYLRGKDLARLSKGS